jgi:hypothetical protein
MRTGATAAKRVIQFLCQFLCGKSGNSVIRSRSSIDRSLNISMTVGISEFFSFIANYVYNYI